MFGGIYGIIWYGIMMSMLTRLKSHEVNWDTTASTSQFPIMSHWPAIACCRGEATAGRTFYAKRIPIFRLCTW